MALIHYARGHSAWCRSLSHQPFDRFTSVDACSSSLRRGTLPLGGKLVGRGWRSGLTIGRACRGLHGLHIQMMSAVHAISGCMRFQKTSNWRELTCIISEQEMVCRGNYLFGEKDLSAGVAARRIKGY